MLLPLPRLRSAVCVLVFVVCFCSASQPVCNKHLYGVPNYRDCLSAWNSMPFALEPSGDYKSRRYQLWSEPQYLEPAFGGVVNRFKPLPINQLPKVWRYNTCRLALMSEGRPNGSVVNALWAATWRAILDQMLVLFVCGSPRSGIAPSGGYMGFANDQTGRTSAALYIYSAYSPFENVINRYMSGGRPIVPFTPTDQSDVVRNSSINITQHTLHIPVELSSPRSVTLLDQRRFE